MNGLMGLSKKRMAMLGTLLGFDFVMFLFINVNGQPASTQ